MEILLLDELAPDAQAWLVERHQVSFLPQLAQDRAELQRSIYKTRALFVTPGLTVDAQLLDFAPRLAVVASLHGDTENIDDDACRRRRVRVVRAINANVRANAEFQLVNLLTMMRNGAPQPVTPVDGMPLRGREINDSVIGLLGMTPTAHLLATMLTALGARVIGYDPALHRTADLWQRLSVQPVTLPDLLQSADAVAVQMVFATRHKGLIGEGALAQSRTGQFWSSISAPTLFDLPALADALRTNRLGACVLDLSEPTLIAADSPLRRVPRLRITPNMAGATQEALLRSSWYLADRTHELLQLPDAQRFALESMPMPI